MWTGLEGLKINYKLIVLKMGYDIRVRIDKWINETE